MSENNTWIRTVYLYLFALAGLMITVIGSTMLVNLALKTWIFTEADSNNYYVERPPSLMFDQDVQTVEALKNCNENCQLTDIQLKQIDAWLTDYQWWLENSKKDQVDYQKRERQQQASTALSMIIIGLPLYLYHWGVIKNDRKKRLVA